jgi:hypothetical protein
MSTNNQFINHTIKQINDLTDVIYEELHEDQSEELMNAIQELIQLLNSIVKDYEI